MIPGMLVAGDREGQAVSGTYSIQRVTYYNVETSYAVLHLVPVETPEALSLVAVGLFHDPQSGECYEIQGTWRRDAKYGMQIKVALAEPVMPQSLAAIERYLGGASIKGLGTHYAKALVEHFGTETYQVLQSGGARLEEVTGIGPVRASTIRASWAEHQGTHELMVRLQGIAKLSPHQAQRLYREYGQDVWHVIESNPYQLAEIRGFGFKTCDRIGRSLGIADDAPERVQAGILHLLNVSLAEGHLWTAQEELQSAAAELLGVPASNILPQIDGLLHDERIICQDDDTTDEHHIYLPQVWHTEHRLAQRLGYWLWQPPHERLRLNGDTASQLIRRAGPASLTDEQHQAIHSLLTGQRLVVLTGGPGTGKTTTVRTLIACLDAIGVSYALCATTGRASKQLLTSTGHGASTVHRHLGIGIGNHETEAIQETVLIIDESSMIDLWLFDQIVERLTPKTHLCLVGDVDQLPSVGPGAILQDLIAVGESGTPPGIAITRLARIFRQEAGDESLIVRNCHLIRQGQRPEQAQSQSGDYFEMHRSDPEDARSLAVDLVAKRLPEFLQIPASEIQLLAPMHGGRAGIRTLNESLQATLNPPAANKHQIVLGQTSAGGRVFREGDKVRQTRNNYQKQVLNGDLGIITRIDPDDRVLQVRFEEQPVDYLFEELDELLHSWAMTVHAAQGSQWPAVVILMLKNHYVMLERNILYTALSRAQRLAVLVTQEYAVQLAVQQDRSLQRRTSLVDSLRAATRGISM